MSKDKKKRKAFEGRRAVGVPGTEIANRKGTIVKVDKDWQFRMTWDDKPGVTDDGYQLEELKVLHE